MSRSLLQYICNYIYIYLHRKSSIHLTSCYSVLCAFHLSWLLGFACTGGPVGVYPPVVQYVVYNCILRQFPKNLYVMYGYYEKSGNLFTSTIYALASAIQKLSRTTCLPAQGLTLYRGLGGLMDIPDFFFKPDEIGSKSMTEWGFMSTTSSKETVIKYSGVERRGRAQASCNGDGHSGHLHRQRCFHH